MRLHVLLVVSLVGGLAGVGGCHEDAETLAGVPDDGTGGVGGGAGLSSCTVDDDCATAAATCCECPTFAVGLGDPANRACDGVACPGQETCPANVRAACDEGQCVLACVAMACPAACPTGYALDPTGCLSCACAAPQLSGCVVDTDCVQTRADCCGCARGGEDLAVLASERAAHDAALGCPAAPLCPSIDVCEPDAAPRCIQGRCELTGGSLPAGACGRPDLPECPAGTQCTINESDLANEYGVGVCGPP